MKYEIGDVIKLKADNFKKDGELYNCALGGHPFILMGIKDDKYIACIASSKSNKVIPKFPYNVPLDNAIDANLNKSETHVKLDKQTIPITDNDILERVGHISDSDYIKLLKVYNIIPNNRIITMEDLKVIKENINLFELLLNV